MYSRPTLSQLVERVRSDVLSRLPAEDTLRRADAEVYARVLAGISHGLYGFIEWLANQIIFDTAEREFLERWCSIWGIYRKSAAKATGIASFTAQAGALIPAGTLLQALDGLQYQTTLDATGTAPTFAAPIQAVLAGVAGNRSAGQALTLVSPVVGVQSGATAGLISGGADVESDDDLRARLLFRIQQPPQGGSASDYVAWALQVPGATRAWVYPNELGVGTVVLRFVRDNDGAGAAIIPDAGEVAAMQAYVDALRPVTAQLTVLAPVSSILNFTISGLSPNTAAVRAAVEVELKDLLLREAVPGGTLLLSHIRAAISAASGEDDFALTAPSANVVNASGQISIFGGITWV